MITYQLPRRIRFVPASGIFSAAFGVPTVGKYDFDGQIITLFQELLPNSVYLIDAFSIGGNIAAEDFLAAIDTVPLLSIRKNITNENIFDLPIQIQSFFTDRQIVHFFRTGQNKTGLSAYLSGVLNQTPALVGVSSVDLSLNISLHAIDESSFEKEFSGKG